MWSGPVVNRTLPQPPVQACLTSVCHVPHAACVCACDSQHITHHEAAMSQSPGRGISAISSTPLPGDSGYRFPFAAGFPIQMRGRVSRMSPAGGTIARRSRKFCRRKTFRSSVLRFYGGGQEGIHARANLSNHCRQVKDSRIMISSHLNVVPRRQISRHCQCF